MVKWEDGKEKGWMLNQPSSCLASKEGKDESQFAQIGQIVDHKSGRICPFLHLVSVHGAK